MKGYTRDVTIRMRFVEIDGVEYRFDDVLEAVEELEGADGFCTRVLINDPKIGKMLEEKDVARRNARGSYGAGPKQEEFLNELYQLKVF